MKITSLGNAKRVPFNLEGFIMHESSSVEVIHLCLQPGQSIPQHTNDIEVIACLLEGYVTLQTGELETILSLYDVAEIEKDSERGFTNTGNSTAHLLIIKKH